MNILEENIVEITNKNLSDLWKVLNERDLKEERRLKEVLWVALQAIHLVVLEMYRIPEKPNKKNKEGH